MKTSVLRYIQIIMAAAMLSVVVSCHSNKTVISGDQTLPYPGLDESVTTEQMFESLVSAYTPWRDVYMPVTLSLQQPASMSISGRATMVRDEYIYISLRALGMEIGQLYADNDSIYVVDKYHKIYMADDIGSAFAKYGFTLSDLQSLLLGRAFTPGYGTITLADNEKFIKLRNGAAWTLMPEQSAVPMYYNALATDPVVLQSLLLRVNSDVEAVCEFEPPVETPCGPVSPSMAVSTAIADKQVDLSVNWDLPSAKWDTDRSVTFTRPRPDKYKRVYPADLIGKMNIK